MFLTENISFFMYILRTSPRLLYFFQIFHLCKRFWINFTFVNIFSAWKRFYFIFYPLRSWESFIIALSIVVITSIFVMIVQKQISIYSDFSPIQKILIKFHISNYFWSMKKILLHFQSFKRLLKFNNRTDNCDKFYICYNDFSEANLISFLYVLFRNILHI